MARPGALGVVRGRAACAGAPTPRSRRTLAVGGIEVHPRRHPDHRAHARGPYPADHALRVRELVGVEAPGVVLASPRASRSRSRPAAARLAVALEVVDDVALVLVDVAALPVPVCPLGEQGRQPGQAQVVTQPRGRGGIGEQAQAQRPGRGALGDRDALAQVELQPGAPGLDPQRPSRRSSSPGRGGVVALRMPPVLEHLRRAVGPGVAAVGAEADPASPLVERLPSGGRRARSAARRTRAGPARRRAEQRGRRSSPSSIVTPLLVGDRDRDRERSPPGARLSARAPRRSFRRW